MSSDTLRARIAAAIMQTCHGVYLDDAVDAADAVIRELGLRREDGRHSLPIRTATSPNGQPMSDQPGCPCSICDEDYMTDQSGIADLHTSTAPVEDSLRTRIASAISGVDDWRGVTDPAILADAVIRELLPTREGRWGWLDGTPLLHMEVGTVEVLDE